MEVLGSLHERLRFRRWSNPTEKKMEQENKSSWDSVKEWTDRHPNVVFGLKVAVVATVGIVAAPAALGAAGFGAGGVAAGGAAAGVQSAWFGGAITGATGVVFSALQSASMAGLPLGAKLGIGATSAAIVKWCDSFIGSSEEKGTDSLKK